MFMHKLHNEKENEFHPQLRQYCRHYNVYYKYMYLDVELYLPLSIAILCALKLILLREGFSDLFLSKST